jgi:type IV pilus assembly protein PilX
MSMNHIQQQTGSALIVSLTLLLILTVLGVSAMRTTSLEDKMAGNARDVQTAFEAAEFALRQAEQDLANNVVAETNFGVNGGTGAYFTYKGLNPEAWTVEANWAIAINVGAYGGDVAKAPQYMIQQIDTNLKAENLPGIGGGYPILYTGLDVYQITARGFGISPNSRVMLQTYYRE